MPVCPPLAFPVPYRHQCQTTLVDRRFLFWLRFSLWMFSSPSQTLWLRGQEAGQHNRQHLPPLCWAGSRPAGCRHRQLCLQGHAWLFPEEMNCCLSPCCGGFLPLNFGEGLGAVPRRRARKCIGREGSELIGGKGEKKGIKVWIVGWPEPTKHTYRNRNQGTDTVTFPAKFKRRRQLRISMKSENSAPQAKARILLIYVGRKYIVVACLENKANKTWITELQESLLRDMPSKQSLIPGSKRNCSQLVNCWMYEVHLCACLYVWCMHFVWYAHALMRNSGHLQFRVRDSAECWVVIQNFIYQLPRSSSSSYGKKSPSSQTEEKTHEQLLREQYLLQVGSSHGNQSNHTHHVHSRHMCMHLYI